MKAFIRHLILLSILLIGFVSHATELGIQGSRFTINGSPTFLLGISYYGALGAPDKFIEQDLDDIQRGGFNWIRVWANWAAFDNNIMAINSNGAPQEPFFSRLVQLVAQADKRGLVVDITLAREKSGHGPARLLTLPDHLQAVQTLVTRLKPFRNWYLDLANERNVGDSRFVSYDDLKKLRDRAKELDPARLLTASHSSDDASFIHEMEKYLKIVQVDFLSQHRPRSRGTFNETEAVTRRCVDQLRVLGVTVPIHYQEPFRRGYQDWNPQPEDFITDLKGAIAGGAAGWCFHNGSQRGVAGEFPRRSFDLRQERLFDQLDDVEKKVVSTIHQIRVQSLKAQQN